MAWHGRAAKRIVDETGEIVHHASASTGGIVTAIASAVALIFSAISLYHSVLKQPELNFYVSRVVHYTRDANGNYEVLAIPMTIANHGARDGAILDIEVILESTGAEPAKKLFYSAYMVDGDFFVKPGAFNATTKRFDRVNRPKTPFAPISIAGRDNFTGTILFYPKSKPFPKIIHQDGTYRVTVRLQTRLDNSMGMLDRLFAKTPEPVSFEVNLPYYSESNLLRGETHRLYNTKWRPPRTSKGADGAE